MLVRIIAKVDAKDEESMRQALADGDYTWAEEINPRWVDIKEVEE